MGSTFRRFGAVGAILAVVSLLAACGSAKKTTTTTTAAPTATTAAPVSISVTSFTSDYSVMKQLASVASAGTGLIGVILPESTTSGRYVQFDAPDITKAFEAAGLTSGKDFKIDNAQGSTATELTQAQADITAGAKVLLMDPIDSGVGAAIESYAKSHNVKVIDYDRITTGGPPTGGQRDYYVSFDNVKVGQLIGQGFVDCVSAWNVKSPHVLVMRGAATDNNATLFAQGYNGVLQPKFDSAEYVKVGEPTGTWDPPTAQTTFQQQYTAHKEINAVVMPNDLTSNAVISALKTLKIPAKTFPTTGQDAEKVGLQNILTGYQCGTVYKPIWNEAQVAAALALYLRAGQTPPKDLVNGSLGCSASACSPTDTTSTQVPSALLTPIWVTSDKIQSTVIKDGFVKASDICTGEVASACTAAGVS